MIRGAQKRIVVMKTADSAIFDEAYFVLKKGREASDGDMVREANRIIDEADGARGPEKGHKGEMRAMKLSLLICGMGAGSVITAALTGIAVLMGG